MESRTFSGGTLEYFGVFLGLFGDFVLISLRRYNGILTLSAISIAYSEKYHFPSLARKKSEVKGNIYDFFRGFFQRSLGKNLGTVATSCSCPGYLDYPSHELRNEMKRADEMARMSARSGVVTGQSATIQLAAPPSAARLGTPSKW